MPDDINPITPPATTPTDAAPTPVVEPAVNEAQSVLDEVVGEVSPEEKPVEVEKTVETGPTITEHPISDEQAKQFAGMGDFALPQSPLDNLDSVFGKVEPEKQEDKKEEESTESQPITPMVVSEIKPEEMKPDLTPPPPAVPSATLAPSSMPSVTKDLEKKAEGMLKELGAASGSKPKKKMSGSTVKMALAAVLVVLMGAGGLVGMNLLKMQQVADERSQAGGTGTGCVQPYVCDDSCSGNVKYCYHCNAPLDTYGKCPDGQKSATSCGSSVEGCGVRCHCCDGNWVISSGTSCSGVCDNNEGEWGNCTGTPDKCGCTNWSDGCGTDCRFPAGTQEKLNQKSRNNDCKQYVAMCAVNGEGDGVYIEEYKPIQACYGKLDQCNNPISTCDSTPPPTDEPLIYSCTGLSKNVATPAMGSELVFTCAKGGTATVNHYEFRYRIGTGANVAIPAGTGNKSGALTIAALGDYTVECRICKSTDSTDCTVWGAAGK